MSKEITVIEDGKNVIALIAKVAENPDVDVEKMAKLVELQEKIYNKQAEIAYNCAMQEVQQEIPNIKALSKNSQTNSMYAKLEHINKIITPIYTKHGFSLTFGMADCPIDKWFRTTCTIRHNMGHSEKEFIDLPIDDVGIKGSVNKTQIHATGSSNSYARRYLTVMIFNLAIGGEDTDGNIQGEMTEKQLQDSLHKEVNDLLRKLKADKRVPHLKSLKTAIDEGTLSVDFLNNLKDTINSEIENV